MKAADVQIHEAAHTFTKKFFNKHPEGTGTPESTHLGDIYMISPEGKFLESYSLDCDTHAIAADWAQVQRAWNISRPSWHGEDNYHLKDWADIKLQSHIVQQVKALRRTSGPILAVGWPSRARLEEVSKS